VSALNLQILLDPERIEYKSKNQQRRVCFVAQLEYVSIAGFLFVLMLLITMIVESCRYGLPAIGDGEFSVVGFTDICECSTALKHQNPTF
jgi:hypothetical protein